MNRGYIHTIIFVILAVIARHTVRSVCLTAADCVTPCKNKALYDRVRCGEANKYCECSSAGKGNPIPCTEGYIFDEPTESCIWQNNPSASASDANGDSKFDCAGRPNGYKVPDTSTDSTDTTDTTDSDAPPRDSCRDYKKCEDQIEIEGGFCANNTEVLNPMIGDCVPVDTYVCTTDRKQRVPDCSKISGPIKFYSDQEDCAGYYYCTDGVRVKGKCDAQKYDFDPIGQRCAYKSGTCKPSVASKSSDSALKDFNWDTICKGKSGQFLADPRVCTAYILCMSETKPRQDSCKVGTYFNNGFCSKTPPKTCNCELLDPTSFEQDPIQYAPHEDKNKFYVCSKTGREEKTCPQGTIWNDKAASCVTP